MIRLKIKKISGYLKVLLIVLTRLSIIYPLKEKIKADVIHMLRKYLTEYICARPWLLLNNGILVNYPNF